MCVFFLMIRRPPRSTRTDTLFPTRRSSDLHWHRRPVARPQDQGEKLRLVADLGDRDDAGGNEEGLHGTEPNCRGGRAETRMARRPPPDPGCKPPMPKVSPSPAAARAMVRRRRPRTKSVDARSSQTEDGYSPMTGAGVVASGGGERKGWGFGWLVCERTGWHCTAPAVGLRKSAARQFRTFATDLDR